MVLVRKRRSREIKKNDNHTTKGNTWQRATYNVCLESQVKAILDWYLNGGLFWVILVVSGQRCIPELACTHAAESRLLHVDLELAWIWNREVSLKRQEQDARKAPVGLHSKPNVGLSRRSRGS